MKELLQKLRQLLLRRRHAYRTAFLSPFGQEVLVDLAKFCYANESAFDPNDRVHAGFEGRREVWLRIQHHLQLSPDQLWKLYDGREE